MFLSPPLEERAIHDFVQPVVGSVIWTAHQGPLAAQISELHLRHRSIINQSCARWFPLHFSHSLWSALSPSHHLSCTCSCPVLPSRSCQSIFRTLITCALHRTDGSSPWVM